MDKKELQIIIKLSRPLKPLEIGGVKFSGVHVK